MHDDGYTFYGLKGDEFKNSLASETIKYLPSAAVINRGEIVDYLDAESDEDIPYYQGADSLREWLQKYINLEKEYDNGINLRKRHCGHALIIFAIVGFCSNYSEFPALTMPAVFISFVISFIVANAYYYHELRIFVERKK